MIKIFGASDDLIEIEGDITEEFNIILEENESAILAVSDGTLLKVSYDGCWRIVRIHAGMAGYERVYEAVGFDDDKYSDEIELRWGFPFEWVALATEYRSKRKRPDHD